MFFKEEVVTDGRVILLDEPLSENERRAVCELETADGQEIVLLEDIRLATELEKILEPLAAPGTLFVFPGNGANFPRRFSSICQRALCVSVHAKRFWVPGEDPEVSVGLICPECFLLLGIKNVVVVDDVISSGRTMRDLYKKNAWRIPGARWRTCAWVSQLLPSGGSIRGYHDVSTACLVRKVKGTQKVPINSLSTLRKNPEIATSYARRHFREPEEFLRILGH